MFEKVRDMIVEKLDLDPEVVTMDSSFADLKIDSLDMVEIVMDLEEEFDIEIENNEDLKTVGDLVKFIEVSK